MTDVIRRLRENEALATDGPWKWQQSPIGVDVGEVVGPAGEYVLTSVDGDDAELICAMRSTLPALLDIAQAAREWEEAFAEGRYMGDAADEVRAALSRLEGAQE